jgi:DNA-binding NarL/FixJ family response regulator
LKCLLRLLSNFVHVALLQPSTRTQSGPRGTGSLPAVARTLMDRVAASGDPVVDTRRRARERFALLTQREQEVARAVAAGLSNADIAGRLFMSVGSVKAHVSSALTRLDLTNRIQLALLAHDASDD